MDHGRCSDAGQGNFALLQPHPTLLLDFHRYVIQAQVLSPLPACGLTSVRISLNRVDYQPVVAHQIFEGCLFFDDLSSGVTGGFDDDA